MDLTLTVLNKRLLLLPRPHPGISHMPPHTSLRDFPEDKWDDVIAVCLSSAFHASKAALPYMQQAGCRVWGLGG